MGKRRPKERSTVSPLPGLRCAMVFDMACSDADDPDESEKDEQRKNEDEEKFDEGPLLQNTESLLNQFQQQMVAQHQEFMESAAQYRDDSVRAFAHLRAG